MRLSRMQTKKKNKENNLRLNLVEVNKCLCSINLNRRVDIVVYIVSSWLMHVRIHVGKIH